MNYQEQNRSNTLLLVSTIALLLGGIGGFLLISSNGAAPPSTITPEESATALPVSPGTPADTSSTKSSVPATVETSTQTSERTLTVVGADFSFSPNNITLKKGTRMKIIFRNDGGFHDLVVDGYQVATKRINGGESDTIEFVADKIGNFAYYCSVGNHRAQGMEGALTVEE